MSLPPESEGVPEQYLDSILKAERIEERNRITLEQEASAPIIAPERTAQTEVDSINIKNAMAMNPAVTSKKILKPLTLTP